MKLSNSALSDPALTRMAFKCARCGGQRRPYSGYMESLQCSSCGTSSYSVSIMLSSAFNMRIFVSCASSGYSYEVAYKAACGGYVPEEVLLMEAT